MTVLKDSALDPQNADGWTVECDLCGRKGHVDCSSRQLALDSARAVGWRMAARSPKLIGFATDCCPPCLAAAKL